LCSKPSAPIISGAMQPPCHEKASAGHWLLRAGAVL
jgi:hypothetical protein